MNRVFRTFWFRSFTSVILVSATLVTGALATLPAAERSEAVGVAEKLDRLYVAYLRGTIEETRRCLIEAISLLEKADFPKISAAPHGLWLAYSRLQVLETRAGNKALADANLLKARYWYLRKLEMSGEPTEKALVVVNSFTAEKCMEIVDSFDNRQTGGSGPNYARESKK